MDVEQIPRANVGSVIGLLEILDDAGGEEDVYQLSQSIDYEIDEIFPVIKAAEGLGFLEKVNGDVKMTKVGRELLRGDINERKKIVKERIKALSVFRDVVAALKKSEDLRADRDYFLELFEEQLSREEAEAVLDHCIDWGRYAELIGYNDDTREIYLDQE